MPPKSTADKPKSSMQHTLLYQALSRPYSNIQSSKSTSESDLQAVDTRENKEKPCIPPPPPTSGSSNFSMSFSLFKNEGVIVPLRIEKVVPQPPSSRDLQNTGLPKRPCGSY